MALKTLVKISKVNNLSDARYCAGMGVDMIGFILDKDDSQYVDPTTFCDITQWISGPRLVGEFGASMRVEDIKIIATNYSLDYLQVENPEHLEPLSYLDTPLIFKMNNVARIEEFMEHANDFTEIMVLSLTTDEWRTMGKEIIFPNKTILNIQPTSAILTLPDDLPFLGFELEATPEKQTGFKDYGEIMDILEALEID